MTWTSGCQKGEDPVDPHTPRPANRWQENELVFASAVGTELDAHNVRRAFRKVVTKAGLVAEDWTPRELRPVVSMVRRLWTGSSEDRRATRRLNP